MSAECRACGACCASYRVSFYWAEAEAVPPALVEKLTPVLGCMAGTNAAAPRCRALDGQVGEQVSCTVYAARPAPCREVQRGDERCARARARHGLPVLPFAVVTTAGGSHGIA
jgi:Fe-S-cluster containining protein